MADFIQWWQVADFAAQATVVGTIIAVLALLWTIFAYVRQRTTKPGQNKVVAKNGSVAAGGDIQGNRVSVGVPSDKR